MKEVKVKPLLSCEVPLDKVNFPVYVGTKLDGIRALVIDGVVYSRSLKPIRNKHVQKLFGKPEYNGFDGELVVGDIYAEVVFWKTTSGVMSEDGEPNVYYYVFDDFTNPELPYEDRQRNLIERFTNDEGFSGYISGGVVWLQIRKCNNISDVMIHLNYEQNKGGEGLILRSPNGKYKYGRSTPKEQYSVKLKFFQQDEFEIVGFTERMHNTNDAEVNELGYTERSSSKEGLVPMNTLGSIVLKYDNLTFACGTGFTDAQRKEIWDNRQNYLGKLASIRYMSVGQKDLPRVPSFQGFRDTDDL